MAPRRGHVLRWTSQCLNPVRKVKSRAWYIGWKRPREVCAHPKPLALKLDFSRVSTAKTAEMFDRGGGKAASQFGRGHSFHELRSLTGPHLHIIRDSGSLR